MAVNTRCRTVVRSMMAIARHVVGVAVEGPVADEAVGWVVRRVAVGTGVAVVVRLPGRGFVEIGQGHREVAVHGGIELVLGPNPDKVGRGIVLEIEDGCCPEGAVDVEREETVLVRGGVGFPEVAADLRFRRDGHPIRTGQARVFRGPVRMYPWAIRFFLKALMSVLVT